MQRPLSGPCVSLPLPQYGSWLFYSSSRIMSPLSSKPLRAPSSHTMEHKVLRVALEALCHLLPPHYPSTSLPPALSAALCSIQVALLAGLRAFALTVPSFWNVFLQIFLRPAAPSLPSGLCSDTTFLDSSTPAHSIPSTLLSFSLGFSS